MSDFLAEGILRDIVLRRAADMTEESGFESRDARPHRPPRSLKAALSTAGRPAFILECKAKSPSQGQLISSYDPVATALALAPWADVLSVLTEPHFFGGSFDHIRSIRQRYDGVILAKDFFIDARQVRAAWAAGADAVLLMLSVLDDKRYLELSLEARRLGMEYVTEIHDDQELERALALGARIVGINNRNLKTLDVSLDTTARLSSKVPEDVTLISESGIRSWSDWHSLASLPRGADAFLIGTSLAGDHPGARARRLLYGEVKVCGLTSPAQAEWVASAGGLYGGLIFANESPRRVGVRQAARIVQREPGLSAVGVFTRHGVEEIAAIVGRVGLSVVQWHSEEICPAMVDTLRRHLPPHVEIWGLRRSRASTPAVAAEGCDRTVLEPEGAQPGGNGILLDSIDPEAMSHPDRWVLAGGIAPDNVQAFRRQFAGVLDVNSGVEDSPGVKSRTRIEQLFAHLITTDKEKAI
jgi:indole-3-glycerol phosphate synthase/phosphoribosylanthranilate isomerase